MKNYVILENQKILKSIEQKKPIGTHNELNELIMIENAWEKKPNRVRKKERKKVRERERKRERKKEREKERKKERKKEKKRERERVTWECVWVRGSDWGKRVLFKVEDRFGVNPIKNHICRIKWMASYNIILRVSSISSLAIVISISTSRLF